MTYTIPLDPRTKKNSMIIAGSGTRCPYCGKFQRQFIRQGAAHDAYAQKALWYLRPKPREPINKPVNIKYLFYMKTHRRVDQSNLIAAADDLLVAAGILADDNSAIVAGHDGTRVLCDKENPRTEIEITEVSNGSE